MVLVREGNLTNTTGKITRRFQFCPEGNCLHKNRVIITTSLETAQQTLALESRLLSWVY
jgi:hypothetical protein